MAPPQDGPGALLRYRSGGVGKPGFPGTTPDWTQALGRFWSHDHAERIVLANATEGIAHVWLLTRSATFREFTNLAPVSVSTRPTRRAMSTGGSPMTLPPAAGSSRTSTAR